MGSIIEALDRLKWTKMATIYEVSFPDLVKAFYVCLKSEVDETLTSMVKGTQIRITRDLLASLFGVTTSGHSGVHTVNIQEKGLGIVGPEFRLKDDKADVNQLNAFNRILHFVVCQIVVPRSATFSTCTRADSDLMFWAIKNQEINTAELMIERIKFASAQVWDTKSKLNVSLPYAHLLTKIFQHYGISVVGDVSEKIGQAIRSRNLRKCVQAAAEPEVAAAPSVEAEASAAVAVSSSRIEDIPPENIEPVGRSSEDPLPSSRVGSVLRDVLESIHNSLRDPVASEVHIAEAVALGHTEEVVMEEAPIQGEQEINVKSDQVEDAPTQGELD
ncbi:hypothetical protein Taro_030630 [Colocasia esculenta]|uniref:Putative plant transposon protein domain-containing protein n=1 Tax=Colocasia esculenta TaxID=4460 RepID=A0A843W0R3_COLES|nr:hypothetical protein [Colocasia esculenta]